MAQFFDDESIWNYIIATPAFDKVEPPANNCSLACPSLLRLASVKDAGWSKEERHHISSCRLCQSTISLAWREECPGLDVLINYLAAPDQYEYGSAVGLHVERDDCERCEGRLNNVFVRALAKLLRTSSRAVSVVHGKLASTTNAFELAASMMPDVSGNRSPVWAALPPVAVLGEEEHAPSFVTLQRSDGVRAVVEMEGPGLLAVTIVGLQEGEAPPTCALMLEPNADDSMLADPVWDTEDHCWVARFEGVTGSFQVALIPGALTHDDLSSEK